MKSELQALKDANSANPACNATRMALTDCLHEHGHDAEAALLNGGTEAILSALLAILGDEGDTLKIEDQDGANFDVRWGREYSAPANDITLDKLIAIGELFGTKKINVNGYSEGGCETCDYGSSYGFVINVRNATRAIPVT